MRPLLILSSLLAVLASLAPPASAGGPWRERPPVPLRIEITQRDDGPGRETPVAPAPEQVVMLRWGDPQLQLKTLVLIEAMDQHYSRAWVVIWEDEEGDDRSRLQVAYGAKAYMDAAGVMHVDGRDARLRGPMAHRWWPDSFSWRLNPAGEASPVVEILDDHDNEAQAELLRHWTPESDLQAYRRALARIRYALTLSL